MPRSALARAFRLAGPTALTALLLAWAPAYGGGGGLQAQVSIAPRLGTLGIGADVGLGFGRFVTARVGAGFVPLEPEGDYDDVTYSVEIPGTVTLGVDLHPGGGGFRLSGGVLYQTDDLALAGTPESSVEIGDQTFSPEQVGTLRGELSSNDLAPFVTLGFGKHGSGGVGLFLDLGVAFLGDPDISLESDGALAGEPAFEAELRKEAERLEDDFDSYGSYYPIVNLGLRIGIGGGRTPPPG